MTPEKEKMKKVSEQNKIILKRKKRRQGSTNEINQKTR